MNTHRPPADDFLARAVTMLFRVIGEGMPSQRAVPAVAAEMGVSQDELRAAYSDAFTEASDAVSA